MKTKLSVLALSVLALTGCQTHIKADGNQKHVNQITWQKDGNTYQSIEQDAIPMDKANIVFIRSAKNKNAQSSANIAINDEYLTSIQTDHYTQTYACAGTALVSVQTTNTKTNDLTANGQLITLQPQQTYYFYIDVEEDNTINIQQITQNSAEQMLASKKRQAHQISRVTQACATPAYIEPTPIETYRPAPEPMPEPIPEPTPAPRVPINIHLNILFDHDKSTIKDPYQKELAQLSDYLRAYPDVQISIAGYTDSTGTSTYNDRLSKRRAETVKKVLINNYGIAARRITAIGYGETRPVASNKTASGRKQNRRVLVIATQ